MLYHYSVEDCYSDTIDPGQVAAERVLQIVNDGWIALLLSLGERAGLLQYLADKGPVDVPQAALDTRVPARYLREWCWGLVSAGILRHDENTDAFALSTGFAPALTASGGPLHWSRIAEQIVAFAALEDDLLGCFRDGRGVCPMRYEGRIQEVMDLESAAIFDQVLLADILPAIGMTGELERGIDVVDLGCGSGKLLVTLAVSFPNSLFTGYDLSASALTKAESRVRQAGLANCQFQQLDLEPLTLEGPFDLAFCCNAAHDLASPVAFFQGLRTCLRLGGVLVLHELSASANMEENARNPLAPGILAFSLFHCLPLALAKDPDADAPGGMWGRERYVAALRAAGFPQVDVLDIVADPANDLIVARTGERPTTNTLGR